MTHTNHKQPKLLIDENIAFIHDYFKDYDYVTMAGRKITPEIVKSGQYDGLIVRSVTEVTAEMASIPSLKFVGTATIGTNHLDLNALAQNNIVVTNAEGCNAIAVAEYVITAIYQLRPNLLTISQAQKHTISNNAQCVLGIVGLGNVGKRLATLARRFGLAVIATDPNLTEGQDILGESVALLPLHELLQQSDIISLHVPLVKTGLYPTEHLFNTDNFELLKKDALLINASRGEVIEEQALLQDIHTHQRQVILDVFPKEPSVSKQILDAVTIATPHIAGYTLEGKARGTEIVAKVCHQVFDMSTQLLTLEQLLPACEPYTPKKISTDDRNQVIQLQDIQQFYCITQDDAHLRLAYDEKYQQVLPESFDLLRKHYPLRREWQAYHYPLALNY